MIVLGIDFGNDSCVVSVWRNGRIDIVTNETNCRYTPSVVAFDGRKRLFGAPAKEQWITNAANTIGDFKGVMDENLTKKWKFDLCNFVKNPKDSTVSFETDVMGDKFRMSPCQALAMLFIKIKADAQTFMKSNERILGCVIAVPPHFNEQERKSVLMAAAIAKLDCHFLIKDTTAVAINYSHYKKFPVPINVIFVDFGHSSIQISACKFYERRLEMIEEVSDWIGGKDIDEKIAEYFMTVYKIRGANKRDKNFYANLLYEVEQLKRKLTLSVYRHQLMNVRQLSGYEEITMNRSEMDKVCAPLYAKIENLMTLCLERSKLKLDEIHSIELVGGSSNIPIMQKLVAKVFDKIPIVTMNRNESVARGCLLKSLLNAKRRGYKIVEKPFVDAVNNFDGNFRAMKDLVRVFQLHRHLKCDRRDSFQITEDEFMGYVETEKKLTKFDVENEKRSKARKDIEDYLVGHMKPGGVLEDCSPEIKKEINDTLVWDFGTRDQYVDLLHYWTQKVEKLSRRKVVRERDDDDMDFVSVDITTRTIGGQCHANKVYIKRLTFSDCDEVTLIESSQSSSTNSESGSASNYHDEGFRSRYRRLKRIAAESHSAMLINANGSQALRQRKKRLPWCCVL